MEHQYQELNGRKVERAYRELPEPFVHKMKDGSIFRIDTISALQHKTLRDQLSSSGRAEVKFCVVSDDEIPGTEKIEQWELIIFPMYIHGEEIAHGAVADDSIVNGNLVVENGQVTGCSSNYCDLDYREVQDPIVNFAKGYVEKKLARHE